MTEPAVAIIGAGAAGIGAGIELRERGVPFVILEAADRVGGRAYTDTTSLGAPWDHGCHWLHCADKNPLVAWADRLGAQYTRESATDAEILVWQDGDVLSDADVAASDEAITAAYEAAEAAGRGGRDVPLSDVLPDTGRWQSASTCMLGLLAGEDPAYVSAQGYADYADTNQDWPVRKGYGALIAQMADGMPVQPNTPVSAIEQGATCARVTTADDAEMEVGGVIVTASTNVLNAGVIRFGAGPAADLLPLIADVPCGAYEKVSITFRRMPGMLVGRKHGMLSVDGEPSLNIQITNEGAPMITAHIAGDVVRGLVAKGGDALQAFALDRLVQAMGPSIRDDIIGIATTAWLNNPWVRGSYSYAKPGTSSNRHRMIAADTGRVAFAGEAFSRHWQATAHGAYQSGRDVAARMAAKLE